MSHFTREHSNSSRTSEKLGMYVKGFRRMVSHAEGVKLEKDGHEVMSAVAHRRWVKQDLARIRKAILA